MSEAKVATSLGERVGLNGSAEVSAASLNHLAPVKPERKSIQLNPEHPFGVTFIIGGTNVRFCVSHPGSDTPSIQAWKWQELRNETLPLLEGTGKTFEDSKALVYSILAKKFVDFVDSHFEGRPGGAPYEKLCAFNFSIAGLVAGEGRDARVSTTNTGIKLKDEKIGDSILQAIDLELIRRAAQDQEGQRRPLQIPVKDPQVLNDAAAGLTGELLAGGLRGVKNGLYIIIGTGVGSYGLVNGKLSAEFAELGHRIQRIESKEDYELVAQGEFTTMLDAEGSFLARSPDAPYAENELAGPWAASKFAKRIKAYSGALYQILNSRLYEELKVIAGSNNSALRPQEDIKRDLNKVVSLDYGAMEKWALWSPSDVLTGLNRLLFVHDGDTVAYSTGCGGAQGEIERANQAREIAEHYRKESKRLTDQAQRYDAQANDSQPDSSLTRQMLEEKENHTLEAVRAEALAQVYEDNSKHSLEMALDHLRWIEFQGYIKELAKFLRTAYKAMDGKPGCAPGKIVVAGGIGELINKLSPLERRKIDWLLRSVAVEIPLNVVEFSSMSPEAREAYVTTAAVHEAFGHLLEDATVPSASGIELPQAV